MTAFRATGKHPITPDVVADWLRGLMSEGQVTELRAVDVPQRYGGPRTVSGYFDYDHLDRMAEAALELSEEAKAPAVYFTMNPLKPAVLHRRYNRMDTAGKGATTTDDDVDRLRWLLVDADPSRVSGVSSSDEEKADAWELVRHVHAYLSAHGWPDPVWADSGNGYHLLYRIDLPTEKKTLTQRILHHLAEAFDSDTVTVDTSVFNPARICKLYGTVARKGDDQPPRQHRRATILPPGGGDS